MKPWTETEETYQRVSRNFPIVPLPHFTEMVRIGLKRLYPAMTPEFFAAQERRVAIHWNMGLTVDRSIEELKPFADAQIIQRRYSGIRNSRSLCAAAPRRNMSDGSSMAEESPRTEPV